MSNTLEITDAKLNQIVKRANRTLRLAAYKAVANAQDPKKYPLTGELEQLMAERVRSRKPDELERAWSRTRSFLGSSAAARARTLGELSKVDLTSSTSIADQVRAVPMPAAARFDRAHLDNLIANPHLFRGGAADAPPPPPPSPGGAPRLDNLELRIRKVKCLDETNPEWPGDDEILLGGTSIDETGGVKVINPITVGLEFDDGESKVYNPPKVLHTFDLTEGGNTFPKDYIVTMILCEQDNGGFPEWLKKLTDELKGYVTTLIATAIGSAIGSVVPGLGTVVGAVVGAVIGFIVNFIVGLWEDDEFPGWTHPVSIKSYQHTFASGTHTSGEKTFWTQAHGGKYQVWYNFRVRA